MNLAEWLVRTARRFPHAPALLRGKTVEADYAKFAARVANLASALQARLGIRPGDRIAIVMSNCVEYLELLYATWFAGAVVVPINFKVHAKEAAWIIEHAEAKAVFVSESVAAELIPLIETLPGLAAALVFESREFGELRTSEPMPAPVSRGRDDLAWLFYTSGTTGRPKGVMISNGNLHAMAFSYFVDVDDVPTADAALYAAPMSHGAGLHNFMHIIRGARHVVPECGGFDPGEVLALARSLRNVSMFAAPTMVRRLVDLAKKEGSNGDGIRTVVYGGGQCTWRISKKRSRSWDRALSRSMGRARARWQSPRCRAPSLATAVTHAGASGVDRLEWRNPASRSALATKTAIRCPRETSAKSWYPARLSCSATGATQTRQPRRSETAGSGRGMSARWTAMASLR